MPRRVLRIGLVVDGSDRFIQPVEVELRRHHNVDRFLPRFVRLPFVGVRVNEWLLGRQLGSYLRQHDVVFFEWAASLLVKASKLSKRGRIVARLHSVELATAANQVNWPNVDTLIVLNETIQRKLEDRVHQALPQIAVIANGVSLIDFQPHARSFQYRLGMVSNLLPIKRIYETILCVHELRQEGHPFTLHVAGKAMDSATRYAWALESLVERLNLSDQVNLCGYVDDVAGWLRDVDVFISNSYWEGQQVALIEAMAAGCYCLSHFWDGVEEMLPPENIFTTDSDLRSKLLAYAEQSELDKRKAQSQMRIIAQDKFDECRMVREIIDLITSASVT